MKQTGKKYIKVPIRWTLENKICEAYERKNVGSSALHGHNHFLITLIKRGVGVQTLNGEEIAFRPGDLFILSPADFHKNTLAPGETYDYYGVKFKYELLDSRLSEMCALDRFPVRIRLSDTTESFISSAFSLLFKECETPTLSADSEVLIKALVEQIFILAVRELPAADSYVSDAFVNRTLGFLQSNFREKVTVSDVAACVGYTPNYFNSIFHRVFGVTFGNYLRNMRLEYAKNLLLSGDAPLTEIAIESGFGSLSHFSRNFSDAFGCTPTQLRRSGQESFRSHDSQINARKEKTV